MKASQAPGTTFTAQSHMASGYALPTTNGGSHFQPGHSHSYSASHLSPGKAPSSFHNGSEYGSSVRKAASNGSLYTHAEVSRETSPMVSPNYERAQFHTPYEQNTFAFQEKVRLQAPAAKHMHSHSRSAMKGRQRGESDLGRPAEPRSGYRPTLSRLDSAPAASTTWFSLPEALTALLIPLPYMLASTVYSSTTGELLDGGFAPLPAYARMQHGAAARGKVLPVQKFSKDSGLAEACALSAATLLLVGLVAKVQAFGGVLDRRKDSAGLQKQVNALLQLSTLRTMILTALSLGLPYYAAMQIGGMRAGLVQLVATTASFSSNDTTFRRSFLDWRHLATSRIATLGVLLLSIATDMANLTYHAPVMHLATGYLALLISVCVLPPPLPTFSTSSNSKSSTSSLRGGTSPAVRSTTDIDTTLLAGVVLSLLTGLVSWWLAISPSHYGIPALSYGTISVVLMTAAILFSQPHTLQSDAKAGLGLGCFLTASCAFVYSPTLWPGTIINGGIAALSYLGVLYDTSSTHAHGHHDDNDNDHVHTTPAHKHDHGILDGSRSILTKFLLEHCKPGSLVHGILKEKDSRRIAYFTL